MSVKKRKVFIIGLDGGTWRVFNPLIKKGFMPHFAHLVENGASGILKSTIPPVTIPAWTSYQTGVNPGKHGLYDFIDYRAGTYDWHLSTSKNLKIKTLWEIASEAGKTVVSINVPMTYPPKKVKGAMIGGIMTPGPESKFTYPEDLYEELIREIQEYIIFPELRILFTENLEKPINRLIHIEQKRMEAALYLMKKFDWQIFMLHNQALDLIQHSLWHYIDREHPKFDENKWKIISKFYKFIDDSIKTFLSEIDDDTTVIVMSDHGFGKLDKIFHLNKWLQDEGYLKITNLGQIGRLENIIKKMDVFKLRKKIWFNRIDRMRVKMNQAFSINWAKTRAFMGTGQTYGHIYINLKGREQRGIVDMENYEKTIEEIKSKLLLYKDPQSGEPVVERVYKKEEIYTGTEVKNAPDLMVKPREGYGFTKRLNEPKAISLCKEKNDFFGTHREEGIFAFYGRSINPTNNNKTIEMVDIMPTILHLTDIEIPDYLDGKIQKEILEN